tara:strand:+ start:325 stop:669 length:345 start_codon:yes stop_codon:yes gene_type:complete
MKLNDYVIKNKQIITWLENKDHNSEFLGKYYGTLDYATARFHTILIKLSQDKIKEQKHEQDVAHCSKVINDFYRYTVKYSNASILLRWYYKNCLHGLGINQIPKVKKLLNSLDN